MISRFILILIFISGLSYSQDNPKNIISNENDNILSQDDLSAEDKETTPSELDSVNMNKQDENINEENLLKEKRPLL